jgi:hypothetical protein
VESPNHDHAPPDDPRQEDQAGECDDALDGSLESWRESVQNEGHLQVQPVPGGNGATQQDLVGIEPAGCLLGPRHRDLENVPEEYLGHDQDEHADECRQGEVFHQFPDPSNQSAH